MASTESNDKWLQNQLLEAGNRLLNDPPSSDVELLTLLEQVESDLSRVEQSPSEPTKNAISPSLKALVAKEFMNHSNEDIKITVASCISEITRVTAPDAPYDDNQMKDVFQLIISSFKKLPDKNSRSYDKRISMLETVSKVRSCVVMLDLECDSLITEMLQHFFTTIRDYHPDIVYSSMENIITLVLEESEEITLELLSPILAVLRKDNEDATTIARRLGQKVLQKCATKIRPTIVQAVNSSHISLNDYTVAVANVCQEPCGDVGNDDLNISSENSVSVSKLANGTSQNELSQVVLEAATHEIVDPDSECLPMPITSNGVTSAKIDSDNSLESGSLKLPKHSDEIKQSKSDDGPSNTEHCSMGAENTIESEDTAEKTTKTEEESLNPLPVYVVPSVVNEKEPSVEDAMEPLRVNTTEASTVSLIEPSLLSGTEPAISSSNIADKEQDTLLLDETQGKEVGSAKAATSSTGKDELSKESLVPSIESSGIVADKMPETIDSKLKLSESTIDSEAKAHKRSSKKKAAGILKEGTSSTPLNTSNEYLIPSFSINNKTYPYSGANGVPEAKPKTLRVVSKEFDTSEDLADKSRSKKAGRSKESLIQTKVSADSGIVKLDEGKNDSKAEAHKQSGKKEAKGVPRGDASSTKIDTSKEDSGTDKETTPLAEVSTKLDKNDDNLHGTSKKQISKKKGKGKASVEKASSARIDTSKEDSGTDTETTPLAEISIKLDKKDGNLHGTSKKQISKKPGKGKAGVEKASSARIDTSKEDSGTETTPLAEVSTKSDKKDDDLHGTSKKQISKKSGKGKASVEKDAIKSATKDVDKDTISTSKTATKNKGKDTSAETIIAISKRKRTPAKVVVASDSKESGENLVGKRIKVWWPDDKEFYEGAVESWNPSDKKHKIVYSDGDEEVLLLKNEKWQLVEGDSVTDAEEGDVKSKKAGASSSSKKVEPETPKTSTKSKGKSPKSASTPSTGKGKSDSSKLKESEGVKVKSLPDSSKARDAKRKTPETSSKVQESNKGKSVNKRRKK